MQSKMAFLIFLSILLVCSNHTKCHARDTITISTALRDNGETLVSAGKKFELGFFSPEGNSSSRYVGIWYYQRKPQTVVWVANRDKPLLDPTGVVAIAEDGKLTVLDRNGATYFSTDLESSTTSNSSAKLLDSGNLVLIDSQSSTHLWQSFENPTDNGLNLSFRVAATEIGTLFPYPLSTGVDCGDPIYYSFYLMLQILAGIFGD